MEFEPFKIKMVEPIRVTTREEREEVLQKSDYNPYKIPADQVMLDFLTDSGAGAMSQSQWSALISGDESEAGSTSFFLLKESVQKITGYQYVIPVHQGRAAERIFSKVVLGGEFVAFGNTFYETTRENFRNAGAEIYDVPCPYDPENVYSGNMDVDKLERLLSSIQRGKKVVVVMTVTNADAAGGQPVCLKNLRAVALLARRHDALLVIDAARFAENAWFIKDKEEANNDRTPAEISLEMFWYFDVALMSAKKDGLSNIGGFIAIKEDRALFSKMTQEVILSEGYMTYGGLSGRDMNAMAVGLQEAIDANFLRYQAGLIRAFADLLIAEGVPVIEPTGGHAVFIDAARMLSHIPFCSFPAWALMCAIYLEGGIRAKEFGNVTMGVNKDGEHIHWDREVVRLAIPRRVYTLSHLRYAAAVIGRVFSKRDSIKGMRVVTAPKGLRHYAITMSPTDGKEAEKGDEKGINADSI